jgi:hypothetical protein
MEAHPCKLFVKCSAPLCPLDIRLKKRVWYADEDVCRSRKYGLNRWVKKQRSIQKRKTKSWFEKYITYQMLRDASRPRQLSRQQREELSARIRKLHINRELIHEENAD